MFLFLGLNLTDSEGEQLFSEERLVSLSRLPWVRHGRIPDWLRHRLVDGLDHFQREVVQHALSRLLLSSLEKKTGLSLDIAYSGDTTAAKFARALVNVTLRRAPHGSPTRDRVFASCLSGKVSLLVPSQLNRRFRPIRHQRLQLGTAGMLAVLSSGARLSMRIVWPLLLVLPAIKNWAQGARRRQRNRMGVANEKLSGYMPRGEIENVVTANTTSRCPDFCSSSISVQVPLARSGRLVRRVASMWR